MKTKPISKADSPKLADLHVKSPPTTASSKIGRFYTKINMVKQVKNNKLIFFILIASFLIKVILMPISTHADLFAIEMFQPLLLKQHIVDIFSYLDEKTFSYYYPPLCYYSFAIFEYIIHFFSNTYLDWMDHMRIAYLNGLQGQAVAYIKAAPNPNILRDLFLAKTPYLLFDIASLIILLRFAKERFIKNKSVILWMVNPMIIYTTYIFGQFDIMVLFFIILGFYLIKKNTKLGFLMLGIAVALKAYPLIIALPTALIYGKDFKDKLKLLIIVFAPFVISIVPTLINSPQLVLITFFPNTFFYYKRPLEGWANYSQFIKYGSLAFSYVLILFLSAFLKLKDKWRTSIGISLIVVLLTLTLAGRTNFHYLIWEMPLMILFFNKNLRFLTIVILIQTISSASYKMLANQLQLGLFAPLNPDYFSSLPTFNSLINQLIPYRIISTFGFLTFTIINIYLIFIIFTSLLFKAKTKEKQ